MRSFKLIYHFYFLFLVRRSAIQCTKRSATKPMKLFARVKAAMHPSPHMAERNATLGTVHHPPATVHQPLATVHQPLATQPQATASLSSTAMRCQRRAVRKCPISSASTCHTRSLHSTATRPLTRPASTCLMSTAKRFKKSILVRSTFLLSKNTVRLVRMSDVLFLPHDNTVYACQHD